MTDDIIQKVFSKYIQLHDCECPDKETNQWNKLIRTKFIMIQQELIEEIKNALDNYYKDNYNTEFLDIQSILIGDNQ